MKWLIASDIHGSEFYCKEVLTAFEKEQADRLVNDILEEYKKAFTSFSDAPDEDKEFLHLFSFICMLSFDVYVKKLLIEKLVDDIVPPQTESKKDKAK